MNFFSLRICYPQFCLIATYLQLDVDLGFGRNMSRQKFKMIMMLMMMLIDIEEFFSLLRQNQQQDRVLSWNWRLFRRQVGWKLDKFYHHSIFIGSILKKILAVFLCMKISSVQLCPFLYFSVGFWVGSGPPPCPRTKRGNSSLNFLRGEHKL